MHVLQAHSVAEAAILSQTKFILQLSLPHTTNNYVSPLSNYFSSIQFKIVSAITMGAVIHSY